MTPRPSLSWRTRLRSLSAARRALRAERWAVVFEVFERDGYKCRAQGFGGIVCQGPLDAHAPLMRSQGGDIYDPDQCVTVCRAHHDFIHAHPAWSYEAGWLVRSWEAAEGCLSKLASVGPEVGPSPPIRPSGPALVPPSVSRSETRSDSVSSALPSTPTRLADPSTTRKAV